jgi:hypothetical protein
MESNDSPPDKPEGTISNPSQRTGQQSEPRTYAKAMFRDRQVGAGIGSPAIVFVSRPKPRHTAPPGEQSLPVPD